MSQADTVVLLRRSPQRRVIEEWALVLVTEGVPASVHPTHHGFVLGVRAADSDRAEAVLAAHAREEGESLLRERAPSGRGYLAAGLAVSLGLILFFLVTGPRNAAVAWFARGSADAGAMLGGEPWRAVTALTLHADLLHVLTNALMAAVLVSATFHLLGVGLGGALVLLAGAGGNYLNALLQGPPHGAVGASTAVFGALGLLGGMGFLRRRTEAGGWRAWLPFGAGFALLAFMGTAGARTDLWAHLLGFLLGGVLGVLAGLAFPRRPGPRAQWAFGLAALGVILGSWLLALR